MKKYILSILVICSCVFLGKAQNKKILASSFQTITNELGTGQIEITYSRPNVKGRPFFIEGSKIAPLGKLWRLGANECTKISFTENVTIAGKELLAGKYALYAIPGKDNWEIIFNKGIDNWGTENYNKDGDVLRITTPIERVPVFNESFFITFKNVMNGKCNLLMLWGGEGVKIPISASSYDTLTNKGKVRPSSFQTISNSFGLGKIEIQYSRPNLKNRTYFQENSELAPIGKLWRLGANLCTKIILTEDITIQNTKVAAGKYAIYGIPQKDSFVIIFNKGLENHGTTGYKESDDVIRFKIPLSKQNVDNESFLICFKTVTEKICEIFIGWGNYGAKLEVLR